MTKKKQRVTLEDVAQYAGVSAMTVSKVINDKGRISETTRQAVLEAVAALGYRPSRAARSLATSRTYMIGVVVPDITNPFFSEIVQGVEKLSWEREYSVLLANTDENPAREEAVLGHIDDSTVDGLIVCSSRLSDTLLVQLIEPHPAVVVINREVPRHMASRIMPRHGFGYRALQAARYLARAGHHNIGYINLKRSVASLDIEVFIRKLAEEGIIIRHEWCVSCLPSWADGYRVAQQLLDAQPSLTAIIGGNDLVALGTMRAAIERGRQIPDDLALIGGDDILLASQVTPPLTTFRIDKYYIGVVAARLLFDRMGGDTDYKEYVYDEILIKRASAP